MGSVRKHGDIAKKKKNRALGEALLRNALFGPKLLNDLIDGPASAFLGGALVITIFEGSGDDPSAEDAECRRIFERAGGKHLGEGPARKWMMHRYAVSYRQAPVFGAGMFSDTIEVAAPWSKLSALYDRVRHALGEHVFVMAHMSHAYPDGCCIYFSFAGSAGDGDTWDQACEDAYDHAWSSALAAVNEVGGTIAHHHGVGRSKSKGLRAELGEGGLRTLDALKKAFDPRGIMNPGNLSPNPAPEPFIADAHPSKVTS